MSKIWTNFDLERPKEAGNYWWRVPAIQRGGILFQPEFVDGFKNKWDGVQNKRAEVPDFAYWNGWFHVMTAGTEWAPLTVAEKELFKNSRDHREAATNYNFNLKNCPFCGKHPTIEHDHPFIGARPYQATRLQLVCCLVKTGYWEDFKKLIDTWNNRAIL